MATVPATVLALRRALAVLAALSAGCVTLPAGLGGHAPKPEPATQMVAMWQNNIAQAADTLHGGVPVPCLAGKVYLLGPESGRTLMGDGRMTVDLFDESGATPVLAQHYDHSAEVVRALCKKDMIGFCHAMPLPLPEGGPPLTKVRGGAGGAMPPAPLAFQEAWPCPRWRSSRCTRCRRRRCSRSSLGRRT
jgi:hypothetical protein